MVGLAPGGITDVTARLYAEAVSEHRAAHRHREPPGRRRAVAAAAVQNAAPDGYTLLVFSGSQHAAVPAVQSAPYDPVKGFQSITLLFDLAALLAVPVTSPANTVAELLDYGKEAGRAVVRLSRRRHPLAPAGSQDRRRHQHPGAVRALSRRLARWPTWSPTASILRSPPTRLAKASSSRRSSRRSRSTPPRA